MNVITTNIYWSILIAVITLQELRKNIFFDIISFDSKYWSFDKSIINQLTRSLHFGTITYIDKKVHLR